MNLYRVHYAWKRGAGSSSEIDYYEDEDRMKSDLLAHHLDIMSNVNTRYWLKFMLARAWGKFMDPDFEDYDRRQTTRIIKVEKAVDNEWVPVTYEFIEPEVRLS